MDPMTGLSVISPIIAGAVKILGRLIEAYKDNKKWRKSIQSKLKYIVRLQKHVEKKWGTKKRDQRKDLLEGIKDVKGDLETLEKNVETPAWKVALRFSPTVKEQLESIGSKLDWLLRIMLLDQLTDDKQPDKADRDKDLRQLEKLYERGVKRLRHNLAKELAADKLERVGPLTKVQYNDHVNGGVYVAQPRTEFPCTLYISKSVLSCTKLILEFLLTYKDTAHLLARDGDPSKLVRDCLEKLFTDVLPKELKKSLDLRRPRLTAQDASLLKANIKKLRSSLDNGRFREIQKACHSKVNLSSSKWTKWEEVVRESEQIEKKLSKPHGQNERQHHGRQQGQQQHKKK